MFLEILLGLAKALSAGIEQADLEERINKKMNHLASALADIKLPAGSLPEWVRGDFTADELFWFATSLTAFFDSGD